MVYKRYILIKGKKYGPYNYKSVREGKKVLSIYVSKVNSKKIKRGVRR